MSHHQIVRVEDPCSELRLVADLKCQMVQAGPQRTEHVRRTIDMVAEAAQEPLSG